MSQEPTRTYHANQALHLSDLINLKFAAERFGTEQPRYLKVMEPDGPSTDGGIKARQAILLRPQTEGAAADIMCGFIDVAHRSADLRSYAVLKAQTQQRFGRDPDISRGEYNRVLDMLQEFLATQQFSAHVQSAARAPSTARSTPPAVVTTRPSPIVLAVAFLLGFGLCFLLAQLGLV